MPEEPLHSKLSRLARAIDDAREAMIDFNYELDRLQREGNLAHDGCSRTTERLVEAGIGEFVPPERESG